MSHALRDGRPDPSQLPAHRRPNVDHSETVPNFRQIPRRSASRQDHRQGPLHRAKIWARASLMRWYSWRASRAEHEACPARGPGSRRILRLARARSVPAGRPKPGNPAGSSSARPTGGGASLRVAVGDDLLAPSSLDRRPRRARACPLGHREPGLQRHGQPLALRSCLSAHGQRDPDVLARRHARF